MADGALIESARPLISSTRRATSACAASCSAIALATGSDQHPANDGSSPWIPLSCARLVQIDLGAVAHNVRQLRGLVGPDVAIYVCLKGDANGCGAVAVARRSEAEGVAGFAFGNVDSALACAGCRHRKPNPALSELLPEMAPLLEQKRLMRRSPPWPT